VPATTDLEGGDIDRFKIPGRGLAENVPVIDGTGKSSTKSWSPETMNLWEIVRSQWNRVAKQLLHKIERRFLAIAAGTKMTHLQGDDSQEDRPPLPCLFQG
jgi:hypothetical protein